MTPDPIKTIEFAGRVAYKSDTNITDDSADQFVKMIIARGHESVVEHASASLLFVTDRGVSHEIVRHRLFSYTQESTRYCNYAKDKFNNEISVIKPPLPTDDMVDIWKKSVLDAEASYISMINSGQVNAQIARSILPNCLKTEIVVTGNCREWRHFLKLRTSKAAHPQMIEVASMAKKILVDWAPVVFGDL